MADEARKNMTAKRIRRVSASSNRCARSRVARTFFCYGWSTALGLGAKVEGEQHAGVMPKNHENVLVVRRTLFDELGAFQGFEPKIDRYLEMFLNRQNNFFVPRSRAEEDPTFKQIIPYAVFTSGEKILHYVRGAKSGEKRLVSKGSIGIGGHINDNDESLFSFDRLIGLPFIARSRKNPSSKGPMKIA